MPYDWTELPNPVSAQWMAYSMMLDEFARELANVINSFTNNVHKLQAWSMVLEGLSEKQKLAATHEFIDTLATNTVNLPYVIKGRFGFAIAHLCHQANQLKAPDTWIDDLPLDQEMYPHVGDKYGKAWKSYNKLKRALDAVGARSFQEGTGNFRNSYNHRFSPRFVLGLTQFATRMVHEETGQVSYGFGGRVPLDLCEISALLESEQNQMYRAFGAFQKLVREHETAIRKSVSG